MSEVYTDFLGQEIREGDLVVYATTSGRSPVQKAARVVSVRKDQGMRRIYNAAEGDWIEKPYTKYKVGVREIKNGRNFTRSDAYALKRDEEGKYRRVDKEVRTTYPNPQNIVKVQLDS